MRPDTVTERAPMIDLLYPSESKRIELGRRRTKISEQTETLISDMMLETLAKRLEAMNITITFTDAAVTAIADKGFDDSYGARPLRRAIQSEIEDALSEKMLDGEISENSHVTCDYQDGSFVFSV